MFKKKITQKEKQVFSAPLDGELLPLNEVKDEAFSNGLLGTGFAIKPSNDVLYMPFDGEVVMVFPTGHAIGIRDQKENEYLIHIGIDTVNLNGEGFQCYVNAKKKVKAGTKLIKFPLKKICEEGYDPVVMVVKTSPESGGFELNEHKKVCVSDKLLDL